MQIDVAQELENVAQAPDADIKHVIGLLMLKAYQVDIAWTRAVFDCVVSGQFTHSEPFRCISFHGEDK